MSNFLASNSPQLEQGVVENTKEQFLRFDLDSEVRVMLSIAQITEVLKIEFARIVPIPQMPPWVMGVYNWRGDILWIVDLGYLLGLDSWDRQVGFGNCNVVILSPNKAIPQVEDDIHLGLVVYRVEDLTECDLREIQPTQDKIAPKIANFASGYWIESEGKIVSVLDGNAIARAMPTLAD